MEKEQELIYAWACKYSCEKYEKRIFSEIQKDDETYFVKKLENEYIKEYNIETLPDLRRELKSLWNGAEIMKDIENVICAAAFKNRAISIQYKPDETDLKEELPVYIYNF